MEYRHRTSIMKRRGFQVQDQHVREGGESQDQHEREGGSVQIQDQHGRFRVYMYRTSVMESVMGCTCTGSP